YLPAINEVLDGLSKEELIKKMVSVEFNRFINYYKKKRDLSGEKGGERSERSSEPREIRAGDPVRYFVNIGSRDDFDWMQLKDFLKETLDLGRDDVFKVDVKEGFSFFNTDGEHTDKVMSILNGFDLNGRRINVEISKNDGGSRERRDHNGRSGGGERRSSGGFGGRSGGGSFGPRKEGGFRSDRSSAPREGGFRSDRNAAPRREPGSFQREERAPRRSEGNNERPAGRSFEAAKNRRPRKS
ncbi:MAG: ATP-dependent helicase DeaD, partial [Bacteroidota bacterium]